MKSKAILVNEISEKIKALHSYECPEVIAMPIIGGNTEYLKWIDDSVFVSIK